MTTISSLVTALQGCMHKKPNALPRVKTVLQHIQQVCYLWNVRVLPFLFRQANSVLQVAEEAAELLEYLRTTAEEQKSTIESAKVEKAEDGMFFAFACT